MINIQITWEYFLGILGFLVVIAWYSNGRFTALETSMEWVRETLKELKLSSDNTGKPAFDTLSPIDLNDLGKTWLVQSGLKRYVDSHRDEFLKRCKEKHYKNPYEVQRHVFDEFDSLVFDPEFDDSLKTFAFNKGTTMEILRRIGGIYLRNICLDAFLMDRNDIDKHKR